MRLREATESFIMSREAKNCSSKTVEWYEVMLMKFKNYLKDNDTDFDKCTITTLRMYLRHLKKDKKFSDKYILGHFRVMKAFFNYLHKEQLIPENPALRLDKPRQEQKLFPILSQSQVRAILAQPDKKTFEGYRNFVMIMVIERKKFMNNEFDSEFSNVKYVFRRSKSIDPGGNPKFLVKIKLLVSCNCDTIHQESAREPLLVRRRGTREL